MKKVLLSAFALLTMAGTGTAQNLPSYVPANGLVGYWPFDGNADDAGSNGLHLTNSGAVPTQDRFGNANKAFRFNGTNSFLYRTGIGQLSTNNSPVISVSYWMKYTQGTGGFLFDIRSSNNSSVCNMPNYTSQGALALINWNQDIGGGPGWVSNQQLPVGGWVHIISEINFLDNTAKIYQNGQQMAITQGGTLSLGQLTEPKINIGSLWDFFDTRLYYYDGDLDDFAIYNRALTQQEITALYQSGNTSTNCLDLPLNLKQGLVGYWPFCGNANDESGNGNNGTVNGATPTADRFGNAGSAYGFNGNSIIKISENTGSQLDLLNSYSISCFIKAEDFQTGFPGGARNILSKHIANETGPNDTGGYDLKLMGPNPVFINHQATPHFDASTEFPNSNQILQDVWYHLVCTYNKTTWKLNYFINSLKTDSASLAFNLPDNQLGLVIGASYNNNSNSFAYYFKGIIDDIAIWNRALSQQEITQLYNQGICKTSITVTDTLLIHTGITSYNPVAYQNTLKVWPNPSGQNITLDAGNLSSMAGWKYKVANTLGQNVVNETAISQQQTTINLSSWGGNGIYYLHLINPQGHAVEIKKIVLAP